LTPSKIERSISMILRTMLAATTAISVLVATPSFATDNTSPAADGQITFRAETTYPESLSWSTKQQRFFVSSVRKGTIGKVSRDGIYTPFITDDRLVSTVGLLVDDSRNALWVTNSDPGAGERTNAASQGKLAGLARYDATTGKLVAYHDLGKLSEGAHFANDIALDGDGNAYVTDSFAPVIYKVDTSGKASIFAENPLFKNGEGFNLNGIAYLASGHLLVGKYNSGEIFKVSIADPGKVTKVELPEPLTGIDGFSLVDSSHLVAVVNLGSDKTVELSSADGWNTARISREQKSIKSMPTAATRAGDHVWVLNARLDTLFDPKAAKVSDYLLQKF
jgi:hypothetical protein